MCAYHLGGLPSLGLRCIAHPYNEALEGPAQVGQPAAYGIYKLLPFGPELGYLQLQRLEAGFTRGGPLEYDQVEPEGFGLFRAVE